MRLRNTDLRLVLSAILAGAPLALLCACPSDVEHVIGTPKPPKPVEADETDPRVVREGEDLYPAKSIERAASKERPVGGGNGLGTGKPDETNGVCRLYAPELPDPECCAGEWGFDARRAQEQCGLELYLGESFHFTCGYYFSKTDAAPPVWFRASFQPFDSVQKAVDSHDSKMRQLTKNPAYASKPIPGVPGGFWSSYEKEGLNWAFLPGWTKVRQISWKDEACSEQAVMKLLAEIHAAKQPPEDAPRASLLPAARTG